MSFHHTEKESIRQLEPGHFLIYKHRSETLAVLLERFRTAIPEYRTVKITYAGRLDPMAEGVVLLLTGDACHKKDSFLGVSKTYEVEVLLGVGTDTDDPLGCIESVVVNPVTTDSLTDTIQNLYQVSQLPYPNYASVLVAGKPLFWYAKNNIPVQLPVKKIQIHDVSIEQVRYAPFEIIAREAIADIGKVVGDFRQLACMKSWERYKAIHHTHTVQIITLRITASSGTYMRSIARWIGAQYGIPALAYKIKRTKIGEYYLYKKLDL